MQWSGVQCSAVQPQREATAGKLLTPPNLASKAAVALPGAASLAFRWDRTGQTHPSHLQQLIRAMAATSNQISHGSEQNQPTKKWDV